MTGRGVAVTAVLVFLVAAGAGRLAQAHETEARTRAADQQAWDAAFGVEELPASLLVDRQGRVVARGVRGAQLEDLVRRHMEPEEGR